MSTAAHCHGHVLARPSVLALAHDGGNGGPMHRSVNWALMMATLGAAFALYAIKYDTRRLELHVRAQERALEKAEADVTILQAERAYLARPERLEPLARLIGLGPIVGSQYQHLDGHGIGAQREVAHADASNAQ
jgi:cell division protein FtsL